MFVVIDFYDAYYDDPEVIGIVRSRQRANELICCRQEETDGECDCHIYEFNGEIED